MDDPDSSSEDAPTAAVHGVRRAEPCVRAQGAAPQTPTSVVAQPGPDARRLHSAARQLAASNQSAQVNWRYACQAKLVQFTADTGLTPELQVISELRRTADDEYA